MHRPAVFIVVCVLAGLTGPASAQSPQVLRPPVDAEVSDPFRAPSAGFGPGNRGLEYATEPGVAVVAAAPGLVVFAGPVAGRVWLTIDHGAGLRTTYGPLAGLRVVPGDVVRRGTTLARTTGPLHFGARLEGVYVDPASLVGVFTVRVQLVGHDNDDADRWLALVEREERVRLLLDHGGGVDWGGTFRALIGLGSGLLLPAPRLAGWEERADSLIHNGEVFVTLTSALRPERLAADLASGLRSIVDPEPCTSGTVAAAVDRPGDRRIAVLVDGLDSTSETPGALGRLDLDALGYAPGDIVRHSYAGGLVPDASNGWPVPRTDYAASETRADVEPQIAGLASTLHSIATANPGVTIDLYGHSLGGLIVRHAAVAVDGAVPLGVAVTFAAPHSGAPLAEFVEALELTTPGSVASILAEQVWSDMALVAPAIEDLSESGFAGDTQAVAFPESVHAVTIGARADIVVPASEANAPGARHVVVGGMNPVGAHTEFVGSEAVAEEVRLALAGLPPRCSTTTDAVLDLIVSEAIVHGEHGAALAVLLADLPTG